MAHALIVEGTDPFTRESIEDRFEPMGHDLRASKDERYKRATWGTRPEDAEAIKGLIGDVTGEGR